MKTFRVEYIVMAFMIFLQVRNTRAKRYLVADSSDR